MKKIIVIVSITLCTVLSLRAEGIEHENVLTVRYGGLWQQDEYLSPLRYSGQMVGLQNEWWQTFRRDSAWTHTGVASATAALMYQPSGLNAMYGIGVQGGWGAQYNFGKMMKVNGLNIYIGPYMEIDFLGRIHAVQVNKPYSMDLAMELKAHAGLSYNIAGKRSAYRLQYALFTGLFGMQYVPEYWQSYYELATQTADGITGTALHNKQSLRHELTIDMQFRHSAWRIGVCHEYIGYTAHNLHFRRESVCLVIGTVFNYVTKIKPYRW